MTFVLLINFFCVSFLSWTGYTFWTAKLHCGDERIIVFTTNFKERLDPALIRPGRMDVHIHMSYCTPSGFNILASNYLGLDNHFKFGKIQELLTAVNVTPAEIALIKFLNKTANRKLLMK